MYTIIGGDGREYGPVTAEQVRGWIAGGRANLQTKIKVADSAEWHAVSDFPELVGGPAAAAAPAVPPLPGAFPTFTPIVKLDILSCYERSWALLKANFWPFVGAAAVIVLVSLALGEIQRGLPRGLASLVGGLFGGGFYYYFLLRVRGQPATVATLFAGFTRAFVPLLVAGIVVPIFVIVGMFCLLLPGIYLAVAYSFAYLVATDKQLGFWESMEASRTTVTRHWWSVLGLILLGIPFMLLGMVALGVGILVALPLIMGAIAYAYEDLFGPGP
jgi:hypothetical protein